MTAGARWLRRHGWALVLLLALAWITTIVVLVTLAPEVGAGSQPE